MKRIIDSLYSLAWDIMLFNEHIVNKTYTCFGNEFRFICQDQIILKRFPDFFIVGPQRTGITWLWSNLLYHPEILLAYPKEPHYFSNLEKNGKFLEDEFIDYLESFKPKLWLKIIKQLYVGFYYRTRLKMNCVGEASASNSVLNDDTIQFIKQINTNVKVIITIRNPIERAWSNMKFDLLGDKCMEEIDPTKIADFFVDNYQLQCSQYS